MRTEVQQYYGKTLQASEDLKTNACCTADTPPDYLKKILSQINDEVAAKYYGCGLIAPSQLDGAHILDLGSGSGRDCYVLSALVGEHGSVTGVDMTPEQLAIANQHIEYHREKFGFTKANTRFLHGYLEELDKLDLKPNSMDVIVSNCVLNLCMDKEAVLKHTHSLLKEGGELYFSDVYADRRIPQKLAQDPILYGECLSGALYWNDFINMAKRAGFADPRLVEDWPLTIENSEIENKLGNIRFYSATYRLFKLDNLEPACEDYGQAVCYKGTIAEQPTEFILDKHHVIETGRMFTVCGNTYTMLANSRFAKHFDFFGNSKQHYGIFTGCGTSIPFDTEIQIESLSSTNSSCC